MLLSLDTLILISCFLLSVQDDHPVAFYSYKFGVPERGRLPFMTHLQVQINMSSALHPQRDGQPEKTYSVVEQVLRNTVNAPPTMWVENFTKSTNAAGYLNQMP